MNYLASKYFQWYLPSDGRVFAVDGPTTGPLPAVDLAFYVAACALLLGGALFKVWGDRHALVKSVCIVLGTLIFAGAVHWVQWAIFLSMTAAPPPGVGGAPSIVMSAGGIPMMIPFVVIIAGQIILFVRLGRSRPRSGPPPVPVRLVSRG
jgi:hypothetical protein